MKMKNFLNPQAVLIPLLELLLGFGLLINRGQSQAIAVPLSSHESITADMSNLLSHEGTTLRADDSMSAGRFAEIDAVSARPSATPSSETTTGSIAVYTKAGTVMRDRGRVVAFTSDGKLDWFYDNSGPRPLIGVDESATHSLTRSSLLGDYDRYPPKISGKALLAGFGFAQEKLATPADSDLAQALGYLDLAGDLLGRAVSSQSSGDGIIGRNNRYLREEFVSGRYRYSAGYKDDFTLDSLSIIPLAATSAPFKEIRFVQNIGCAITTDRGEYDFKLDSFRRVRKLTRLINKQATSVQWDADGNIAEERSYTDHGSRAVPTPVFDEQGRLLFPPPPPAGTKDLSGWAIQKAIETRDAQEAENAGHSDKQN